MTEEGSLMIAIPVYLYFPVIYIKSKQWILFALPSISKLSLNDCIPFLNVSVNIIFKRVDIN